MLCLKQLHAKLSESQAVAYEVTSGSVTLPMWKPPARAKGITNDALPVIMSASDWASFMKLYCSIPGQISAKSGANVASNTYGSLLTQGNNLSL